MGSRMLQAVLALASVTALVTPVHAQLRGHGGPVRALAITADGQTAISGSFDETAIRWSLARDAAEQVLRFHEGSVNAVAILSDGRIATAGQDRRVALWAPGADRPATVLSGHQAPVVALAASPNGALLASGSWDHTVRLWPLAGGEPRVLEGHRQNVNAVAFTPDGRAVVSAGYDLSLRIWPVAGGAPTIAMLPAPLNAVVVAADGEIITGGADGKVYFVSPSGDLRAIVSVAETPIIALALSRDGELVAAAGARGTVAIIDRRGRSITHSLVGPGLPVWSAVFLPDNRTLLTGGADRMIRRWDVVTGTPVGGIALAGAEDTLGAFAGDRGAEVFRACVACHTLRADATGRAGPTLAGIFGRKIASLPGYRYSEALKQLDIVWTPETVAKLFEVGPATYTPGTKMPEQTIGSAEDRAALVKFLEKATK
jgi:cytochrome c